MTFSVWKTALFAGGSAVLCGVAYSIVKKTDLLKRIERQCDAINDILFYGKEDGEKKRQAGLDNLFCIYYVLVHANQSIDVCMPSLMSETITRCLVDVQKRSHVQIRVVIHRSEYYEQLLTLADQGIQVKVIDNADNLEHEFILVDATEGVGEAVALMGSLDYEVDRVNCNRDNTLLTSDAVVVNALRREFDRVWENTVFNIDDIKGIEGEECIKLLDE